MDEERLAAGALLKLLTMVQKPKRLEPKKGAKGQQKDREKTIKLNLP
jgi:hypothetical protein